MTPKKPTRTDVRRKQVTDLLILAAADYHAALLHDFTSKYDGAPNYSNEDDVFLTHQLELVRSFMEHALCTDTNGHSL